MDGDCPKCKGEGENGAAYACPECLGTGKKPGDEKLLRFLWSNKHHCYDEETEALVRGRGFVPWSKVTITDELGCWDPVTDSLVYEKPRELVANPYRGKMYRVDHGGVDLLVTPGHRMVVKTKEYLHESKTQRWSDVWRLETVDSLGDRSMIRYRKHAARREAPTPDLSMFPAHDDPLALMRLVGFFLGDGFAGNSSANRLEFHLRKPRKIAFLKETCLAAGWPVEELSSFIVRVPGITGIFQRLFYDADGEKYVPAFLLDLPFDYAEAVLDGLRNSDGTEKRGAWEYTTTSWQLAQAVQLLVLHAGGSAQIGSGKLLNEKWGRVHRVMVLSRMLEPVINQGKRNTAWVDYDGMVYCANTRTGVLVVRRNGKIVLSGNTPFEMAGMTIEVQAPILVFREWHRHRTQGYNEMSARYNPLPDVNYIPTVERLMIGSDGKNKQAGTIAGAGVLTEQQAVRFQRELEDSYQQQERLYQWALKAGVPKELARVHLPVGRYSRMRATSNLRNWLGFLTLRMAPSAQFEIRQFANAVGALVAEHWPRTWTLFAEGRGNV